MPGNTLTVMSDWLKEFYPSDKIVEQFEDKKIFYKDIEKNGDYYNYGGKQAIFPLRKERVQGNGSRAEHGDLPGAGKSQPAQAVVTLKYHYTRIMMTGQTLKLASKSPESFVNTMADMMDDAIESSFKQYNWQLFRTSQGDITQVDGAVTADTDIVVDSVKGLRIGMSIDIYDDGNTTAQATSVEIEDVDESTNTITVDTAVTCDDNAYIYLAGNKDNCLNGLEDGTAVANATYHGIDRTSNSWWKGKRISASAGTITDALMTTMKTTAQVRGIDPKYWLCAPEVENEIWSRLIIEDKRYTNTVKLDGGYETFTYHGKPVLADNDMTDNRLYLMDPKLLVLLEDDDGTNWIDEDGSVLVRISGKDAFEAALRNYSNLLVKRPNAIPYADGITTTSV